MTFVVPSRFCGPPHSGNGGWVSGHAAQLLAPAPGQAVTVRLRTPPPLDRDLTVRRDGDAVQVLDGELVVLEACAAPDLPTSDLPAPVAWDVAQSCGERYEGLSDHPFPTCFSCGTDRDPSDALMLRPGRVEGGAGEYACAWVPRDVDVETVWAALDCPGGWASGFAGRPMVLGTMTAVVASLPVEGEPHVVMSWQRGSSGRKHLSGTALYATDGRLLAHAEATWLAVDPETIRPRGGAA